MYAVAALTISTLAGGLGWKARDVLADRDVARLSSIHSEYVADVVEDTARANYKALVELQRNVSRLRVAQERSDKLREERNQASQQLTEGLRNAQDTGVGDDTIGPALTAYFDQLREYQRSRAPD